MWIKYVVIVIWLRMSYNRLLKECFVIHAMLTGSKYWEKIAFKKIFILWLIFFSLSQRETGGLMRPDIISKSNRPGSSKDDYRVNSFGVNNSREAKNFQKSLRKPPKGIYLNYEELVNLVEVDSDQTFDMLNKKLYCLKKEVLFLI